MLDISLVALQGENTAGRVFPTRGRLGRTTVSAQGYFITKPRKEGATLPVKQIKVRIRCCEIRNESKDAESREEVLWQHEVPLELDEPSEGGYRTIGSSKRRFRIEIPPEAAEFGKSTMTLKSYAIVWRLEAILEHKPVQFVGDTVYKSYHLALTIASSLMRNPSIPSTATHTFRDADFTLPHVSSPVAHGDTIELQLGAHLKQVVMRLQKVIFSVHRICQPVTFAASNWDNCLNGSNPLSTGFSFPSLLRSGSDASTSSSFSSAASSKVDDAPSDIPIEISEFDLPSRPESGALSRKLAECEVSHWTTGNDGLQWSSGQLVLPQTDHGWDIGETMVTRHMRITFEIRIKVFVSPHTGSRPRGSDWPSGDAFHLPPIPLIVTGYRRASQDSSESTGSVNTSRSPSNGLYMVERAADPQGSNTKPSDRRGRHLDASSAVPRETTITPPVPLISLPPNSREPSGFKVFIARYRSQERKPRGSPIRGEEDDLPGMTGGCSARLVTASD